MVACCLIAFILILSVAASTNGEWEIAVCNGNHVELLTVSGKTVATLGLELIQATALAFDNLHMNFYIGGSAPTNVSIFRKHTTKQGDTYPLQPIVAARSGGEHCIQGLAYDPLTATLFWTTGTGRTIMRAQLEENRTELAEGAVLHKFVDELPFGIAVDSCNRTLYWTNSNIGKPTIEKSSFEGQDRAVIVETELFKPMAMTISKGAERYLYWVDENGSYFTIERCALDGSQRQKLISGEHQQPSALIVVGSNLYWTDTVVNSIWSVSNDSSVPLKNYSTDHNAILKGIISNCEEGIMNNTCGNLHLKKVEKLSGGICLNGVVTQIGNCLCNSGFTGVHCEISLCHNLCQNGGKCSFYNSSTPMCSCLQHFAGDRCEIDLCQNHCLNGGYCSKDANVTECVCLEGFLGDRCQFSNNLCNYVCNEHKFHYLNSSELIQCRCDINPEKENATSISQGFVPFGNKLLSKWPLMVIAAVTLALIIIVSIGSVLLYRRKGRPRLRRRYGDSVKSSGRPNTASGGCEIAIEDCCNMNICETPCYEPQFRAPGKDTKSKKEEKCGLLSNMDVQPADATSNDLF